MALLQHLPLPRRRKRPQGPGKHRWNAGGGLFRLEDGTAGGKACAQGFALPAVTLGEFFSDLPAADLQGVQLGPEPVVEGVSRLGTFREAGRAPGIGRGLLTALGPCGEGGIRLLRRGDGVRRGDPGPETPFEAPGAEVTPQLRGLRGQRASFGKTGHHPHSAALRLERHAIRGERPVDLRPGGVGPIEHGPHGLGRIPGDPLLEARHGLVKCGALRPWARHGPPARLPLRPFGLRLAHDLRRALGARAHAIGAGVMGPAVLEFQFPARAVDAEVIEGRGPATVPFTGWMRLASRCTWSWSVSRCTT